MRTTTAMLHLAMACGACGGRPASHAAAPAPFPAPVPAPAPQPAIDPPSTDLDVGEGIRVCVIRDGQLTEVRAHYHSGTGDTLYEGLPFSHAFPLTGEYAGVAGWYVNNEPITFRGVRWIRYAPRTIRIGDLTRVGEYDGVGVYLEAGETVAVDYVYLPLRPGCVFEAFTRSAIM